MSDTGPGQLSTDEAKKIAREVFNVGGRVEQRQNGSTLQAIILSIAGFGMLSLVAIGAYGLMSLVDLKEEVAGIRAKVEILYQERKK